MSSSESFYWHDYETSGADVAASRPVQFAGIRTDLDFKPIGKPLMLYNRLAPDVLPHPAAVRVTGISPFEANDKGLAERDFMARIHAELAQPGTCGVGYNSIAFDDEITRYSLYRNFFDPYERERGQGRSRWDLIDVARAFHALEPLGITWPLRPDGAVSFRLEDLSKANGIAHGAAHDALSDVEATIGLAKKLSDSNRQLFDAIFTRRQRQEIEPLLSVANPKPVVHISGFYGHERCNLALVLPIATHPTNRNDIICADLGRDPDFLELAPEEIRHRLFMPKAEMPEGMSRPGLVTIRLNRAPVVLPATWVQGEVAERLGLNGDRHRAALAAIRALGSQALKTLSDAVFEGREFEPKTDPDLMLYGGFFSRKDAALFPGIRAASADALASQSWSFEDQRLPELFFRYRARNAPESLSARERDQWREHCLQQLTGDDGWERFSIALTEELAKPDLSGRQRQSLLDLGTYAQDLVENLRASHESSHGVQSTA